MSAGDLIQSFIFDPTNVPQGGVGAGSRLVLILKDDIASTTSIPNGTITSINLMSGKSAFSFDGIRQSTKPSFERAASGSGLSVWKHSIEWNYYAYDQTAKNNFSRLSNGRYIAIIENAKQDGNTFEVFGLNVGLEMESGKQAKQENDGGFKIVLTSPENEFENYPPITFDAGTGVYATNRTAIDALLFLPTIASNGVSPLSISAATLTVMSITGTNFFGSGVNSAISKIELVDNATGAVLPAPAIGAVTATTIVFTSPLPLVSHSYKVKVTTLKGVATSSQNIQGIA